MIWPADAQSASGNPGVFCDGKNRGAARPFLAKNVSHVFEPVHPQADIQKSTCQSGGSPGVSVGLSCENGGINAGNDDLRLGNGGIKPGDGDGNAGSGGLSLGIGSFGFAETAAGLD